MATSAMHAISQMLGKSRGMASLFNEVLAW